MSFTGSDGGGVMPPSRLLALLQGLQGAAPQGLDTDLPPPPSKRLGLFGGGYRAYMAGLDDGGVAPVLQAAGLSRPTRQQAMQLASNGACASCHTGAPPPPAPTISLPELQPLPPLRPPGGWASLLPPPLGGLAAAGQIAGVLPGPLTSEYRRSGRGRPPPPAGGNGDPYEWSRKPECTAQHNSDLAVCRSDHKPPECFKRANERLANCNQGKLDFPPLWGWPPRS